VQGEPDGVILPQRQVFRSRLRARGYTACGHHSPAFLDGNPERGHLLHPHGSSLDRKKLLTRKTLCCRSTAGDESRGQRLLKLIGYQDGWPRSIQAVALGAGNFLGRTALSFHCVPISLLAGRHRCSGLSVASGQQFDVTYFGAIPNGCRCSCRTSSADVHPRHPAKTTHNEVAPGQFEAGSLL